MQLAGMLGLAMLLFATCTNSPLAKNKQKPGDTVQLAANQTMDAASSLPYDLSSPDLTVILPPILTEISGICNYDSLRLAGVQDEVGRIFIFRKDNGVIEKIVNFGEDGDYEDIAMVKDSIFVLKSNGDLYRVDQHQTGRTGIVRYQTRLKSRNDCEGLTYVPHLNVLLIACKGSPSLDKHNPPENFRAVYRFLFEKADIDTIPFLLINTVETGLKEKMDWYQGISVKLVNHLSQYANTSFQPSGIACHPFTHDFYILAHVGKMIVVTNEKGKILQILPVDPSLLTQPEGICFDDDGTLYLASEGTGTNAVLAVYESKK